MAILNWASKLLAVGALCAASAWANAQSSISVLVDASGNDASIVIGDPVNPLADVTLAFQDATGLSPASLGVSVQQVSLTDTALLARLPDASLTTLPAALPLLITIEPPANGGLSFRNTGRLEIHTHALAYVPGSAFRVLKAPLGGNFRDVSDEIAQGSVRARTTYGGFSQFLIVADLRPTGVVINEKIGYLRDRIGALPLSERQPFTAKLDIAQAAIAAADYDTAIGAIDDIRARAQARAGDFLANEWRATRDVTNHAGELVAGAATLRFSVAYLRDYGQ
ncbi:hypothetical protein N800_10155 [Lysobacter daejeonensis GH1-9]|uniref:Uncharacterized protein n=1 Tax=Lysobacter daejeonensis GH1-9 TaxID=1385517 RepID=A0A0A0F110_9GAMM|nr:DUF6689 family protein [Lysobacter daejeonensis]KGM55983.1 hypothetical protein N800_10155 [Lysobacter daejeonensis GH1-9]